MYKKIVKHTLFFIIFLILFADAIRIKREEPTVDEAIKLSEMESNPEMKARRQKMEERSKHIKHEKLNLATGKTQAEEENERGLSSEDKFSIISEPRIDCFMPENDVINENNKESMRIPPHPHRKGKFHSILRDIKKYWGRGIKNKEDSDNFDEKPKKWNKKQHRKHISDQEFELLYKDVADISKPEDNIKNEGNMMVPLWDIKRTDSNPEDAPLKREKKYKRFSNDEDPKKKWHLSNPWMEDNYNENKHEKNLNTKEMGRDRYFDEALEPVKEIENMIENIPFPDFINDNSGMPNLKKKRTFDFSRYKKEIMKVLFGKKEEKINDGVLPNIMKDFVNNEEGKKIQKNEYSDDASNEGNSWMKIQKKEYSDDASNEGNSWMKIQKKEEKEYSDDASNEGNSWINQPQVGNRENMRNSFSHLRSHKQNK